MDAFCVRLNFLYVHYDFGTVETQSYKTGCHPFMQHQGLLLFQQIAKKLVAYEFSRYFMR